MAATTNVHSQISAPIPTTPHNNLPPGELDMGDREGTEATTSWPGEGEGSRVGAGAAAWPDTGRVRR